MKKPSNDNQQLDLFHAPVMATVVKIQQADGSLLLRPGKVVSLDEEVTTGEFAKLTSMSQSYVQALCESGIIKCRRLSPKARSRYLIPRSEIARFRSGD